MASGEQLGDIPQVNSGPEGMFADGIILQSNFSRGDRASAIRALSLKYPELTQQQIADRVGCTQQNVSEVLVNFLVATSPERLAEYRANKPEILENVQAGLIASITQEKLSNMSGLQAITGVAILEDKIRLMRGQPTSLHVNMLVNVLEELRAKREAERR